MYERLAAQDLIRRLEEPRRFIQVVAGPRQVGKTTLVRQVLARTEMVARYGSADEPALRGSGWVAEQWEAARLEVAGGDGVLVLDEVQKAAGWAEAVKRLWDEDTRAGRRLRVVLLGSAPWRVQRGLTESLAGRFELVHLTHWSLAEMREAFGWDVDRFVFHGGYPGAAPLIGEHERWARYVRDALIETTISRDVLLLTRVDKPALLRRLFELSCRYSGQVLSYTKMLGQLQDAGNTTTLAHYLDLLGSAGMVRGLPKYAGQVVRMRASSPKLQDWYELMDPEEFRRQYLLETDGGNNAAIETLKALHSDWMDRAEIKATPTFLINGWQLPKQYRVEDLMALVPTLTDYFEQGMKQNKQKLVTEEIAPTVTGRGQ